MTDRDRDLQEAFDRHAEGEGPPPALDTPEAAAYHTVYAALHEPPEGDLPDDFAHQVARRAGGAPEPSMSGVEMIALPLLIAAAGAGLVLMPPSLAGLQQTVASLLMALQDVSVTVRVDVVLATALVLMLTLGLDGLLNRFRPGHPPTAL
jgi:hypothetical protein